MNQLYDLEAISNRLGVSVPALKRRVALLKLEPTERGSRGKLLFDERGVALLEAADALMKEGDGMNTVRRKLNITIVSEDDQDETTEERVSSSSQSGSQRELLKAIESLTNTVRMANETITDRDQKLIDTLAELRRVSETAAALAERNTNLAHQVQQQQTQIQEMKLLAAPKEASTARPWWKFWA